MPTFESVNIQPDADHVLPGVKIVLALRVPAGRETILSVAGRLRAADNKILCALQEPLIEGQIPMLSGIPVVPSGQENTPVTVSFFAPLPAEAIAHIEAQRRRATPNDANFKVEVWGHCIQPAPDLRPLIASDVVIPIAQGQQPVRVLSASADQKGGTYAFVQDNSNLGFLHSTTFALGPQPKTIHASDWSHHFAPKLGLGNVVVVELPLPAAPNGTPLDGELAAALQDLQRAREMLQDGEDDETVKALRRPAEVIRSRLPQIEKLLQDDGYPVEAAKAYGNMMKEQFDLSSKFMHTIAQDKQKTLLPEAHAKHEDVQFLFSTMVTALNVLVRKGARQTPPAP